ncbi:hypothetical protein EP1X_08295 [Thermococcus sp. EP1]|nr:hypothetical protein EP1X_08295 [Thermococcus sp. EP1]
MDGGKLMNILYFTLAIVSLFLAVFLNKSGQRGIGLMASGFAGGFAFLVVFEGSRYPLSLVFISGFIATVFFEYIRFRPRFGED